MTAAAERSLGDHRELRLQGVTTFVISLTSELQPELPEVAIGVDNRPLLSGGCPHACADALPYG